MRLLQLFFFLAITSSATLVAQVVDSTAIRFGIGGAYLWNQHRANFDTIPGIASCCRQKYGGAPSQGFGVSAFAEYPIAKFGEFATFSVSGRVSYFSGLGANFFAFEQAKVQMATATIRHELETSLSAITFEPMAVFRLFKWFTVSAGLQAGTFLQRGYQYRERIIEPNDITYSNGETVFNGASGTIPNTGAVQLALVGGVSYELAVNRQGTVLPTLEAFYTLPLTSPVNGVDWRIASLRLGASLRFSPYRTTEQTPQEIEQRYQESLRQTREIAQKAIEEAREARKKELTARIGELRPVYFNDDEDSPADSSTQNVGAQIDVRFSADNFTIRLSKTPLVQHISLLPMVFFSENSSVIPSRYKQFSPSGSDAANFSLEKAVPSSNAALATKATMGAYYHLLNVVAKRLQSYPQATIQLTGTALENEQNPKRLAEARANAILTYLQDVWHIPAQRVRLAERVLTATDKDKADEMRVVEMASDTPEILQELVITTEKRSVTPQGLQLGLQIAAGRGLKQWDIEISQITARESLTLHTTQGGATYPKQYLWDIRKNPPVSQEDVSIKLSIDDITNNKFEAPIISIKVIEEPSSGRSETFILLANAQSSAQVLRAKVSSTRSRIIGHFTESDVQLKNLALPGLQIKQNKKAFFDSASPEGRVYNRGVMVEISQ